MQKTTGNCAKCGICLQVCPVYKVLKEEHASPRARIQLIKAFDNKKLPSSPLLKELISKCLMCGSCTANCPSGVDHYSQFIEMRSQLIAEQGDRVEIRSLVYLLAKEQRLRFAMGMAKVGQVILPNLFQKQYKLGRISLSSYPKLNKKAFRSEVPEEVAPEGEERGTVLYFTGCATNYIFSETGFSTLKVLSRMGYRVIIPKKQTCCSIPMLFHGGVEEARDNILTNIECFQHENVEAVIVDCPTCGSAFKNEFPAMMRKFGLDDTTALAISGKTTDLMSFIYDRVDLLKFSEESGTETEIATYHLPCHLKNSFVSAERVLENIPGVHYVAASDRDECCGGGGTFFYEYPEISGEMVKGKIEHALETGASVWLTDCPVCRINLAGQLKTDDNMKMMHLVTFLAGKLGD